MLLVCKAVSLDEYPVALHGGAKKLGSLSALLLLLAEGGEVDEVPQMWQPEEVPKASAHLV